MDFRPPAPDNYSYAPPATGSQGFPPMTRPILSGLLFLAAAVGTLSAANITLLSGKTSKGTLVGVTAEFVTVKDGTDTLKISVKDMAAVDTGAKVIALPPGTKYDEIELTDGSILRVADFKLKKKAVAVTPFAAGIPTPPELDLPLTSVFYLCRDAHDLASRERWKKMLAGNRSKRDLFVLLSDGNLQPETGTILEGTDAGDRIVFQDKDDQKVTYPIARAAGGLLFSQPPAAVVPPTVCKVLDVFGNLLFAQAIAVEGGGLTVKTVAGATVTYKSLESVAKLDFASGNVTYLSDLDAVVASPPAPPDEVVVPFLKDKVFGNTPLRLAGKVYPKGLWISPETTLTYKLNGEYREFKAVIGLDDEGREANANSAAKLVVTADGRVLLNQTYTRKDAAKELTLNVKDVKELKITVDRVTLFSGSHLDLADARLQK